MSSQGLGSNPQSRRGAPARGSATLDRGLTLLEVLAQREDGMTASELAVATGLNRVTVHRLLAVFKAHGFVRQAKPRDPYRLGLRLIELAENALDEPELVRLANPTLTRLSEEAGETSHLAVLDGDGAIYIDKVEPAHSVRLVSRVGSRIPLYCTALGKALLASLEPSDAEAILASVRMEQRTPSTVTTYAELLDELAEVRKQGYSIDYAQNEVGVHCVASAVSLPTTAQPMAISISGPSARIPPKRFPGLGKLVIAAAEEISALLRPSASG
jgi:DNA-binding IclR family transcriptional regulator